MKVFIYEKLVRVFCLKCYDFHMTRLNKDRLGSPLMKTIVCIEPGILEKREVERPSPSAGEVLVKIKSIGIVRQSVLLIAHSHHLMHPPHRLSYMLLYRT